MARKTNITVNLVLAVNNIPQLIAALDALENREVLVGFPSDGKPREKGDPITNAELAYIHNQGSPANGIPQREFMEPGIREVETDITARMESTGRKALEGDKDAVEKGLSGVWLIAEAGIKSKIVAGPFQALAPSTIRARQRQGMTRTEPLDATGQMLAAVTSVVRTREPH